MLYREDVAVEPIRYHGNRLIVPDGPGLGVELDPARLEALRGSLVEWKVPAHGLAYLGN